MTSDDPAFDPEADTGELPIVPVRADEGSGPRGSLGRGWETGVSATTAMAPVAAKSSRNQRRAGGAEAAARLGRGPRRMVEQTRRAEQIARRTVGRIISDGTSDSVHVAMVETLRGTPYSMPVQAVVPGDDQARQILHLAVDLGRIMLRAGAATSDVESSVIAVCLASGLANAEVDLTYQSLTVHYTTGDGRPLTIMKVNRGESLNFGRLRAVHVLVTELTEGTLSFYDAQARLDAIKVQKRPYGDWVVTVAWGVITAALVLLIGGAPLTSLIGGVTTMFTDRVGRLLARTGMPYFFIVFLASLATMMIAMLAHELGLVSRPQYMVAAGLVVLLPTMSLFSAVQDALTNFPLTAAGRMINVLMVFVALIGGVATGLLVGRVLGMSEIQVVVRGQESAILTLVLSMVCAAVVAAAGAVGQQVSKRLILPSAAVGLIGYVVSVSLSSVHLGTIVTSLLSAAAVALIARPLALRMGAPPIAIIIPGIFPLLAGLSIFSGAYQLVQPEESASMATAATNLSAAVIANASLGVGAVFGNFLAQPLRFRRKSPVDRPSALSA